MRAKSVQSQKGFSIIEVMIVMAVVGIIMAIVFMAIPALQRGSRNNQHRSGATSIMTTINEFIANNGGQLPTSVVIATDGTITAAGGAGTSSTTGKTLPTYTTTGNTGISTTFPATTVAPGVFTINVNHKCLGNGFDTATTSRAFSVGFNIETSGGVAGQCLES